ncbi:hypothetical protein JIX56_29365 [Streptomyces sp. CA-210063]|uniref:hypothetical protein n=1 Tax=Streptomyces sp. CA-210063 TaxID=2801029 RepID=UPI00214A8E52|nr:hypothetical protein [Streptomyces sp. CA-210063]UUU33627.1 hypothetical protein JIX56_29365 [Streptomyces sp. CA-210063]
MTHRDEETVQEQASAVALLLHHLHIPLGPKQYLRGILPAPKGRPALRLATGRRKATPPDLHLYEIPLADEEDEPTTPHHMLALLQAAHRGTALYSSSRIAKTMGMLLIHLNPSQDPTAPESPHSRQTTFLMTLTCPHDEEPSRLPLIGFLPTTPDTLRLYVAPPESPGTLAADVRLSGPLTAIEASLPTLLTEKERWRKDKTDPHCWRRVDLTGW